MIEKKKFLPYDVRGDLIFLETRVAQRKRGEP